MNARQGFVPVSLMVLAASLAGCIGDSTDDVTPSSTLGGGLIVSVTPESGELDTVFTFDASETPDADDQTFTWVFGDGATDEGPVVEHQFLYTNNLYRVIVTSTNDGGSLTGSIDVPVGSGVNALPAIELNPSASWVGHGDELTVHATVSDGDDDPLEIQWLLSKNMAAGGDGHDHDHGDGAAHGGPDGFGIPEPTGQTGEVGTFTFDESGQYRITARVTDAKGGRTDEAVEVKVTQTVPKTTFRLNDTQTLLVGTAGAGASMILYDAMQPSDNSYIDAARYNFRLLYDAVGTVGITWQGLGGTPADLDLVLVDEAGNPIASLDELDAMATNATGPVTLSPGSYAIVIYANVGAEITYDLLLDLDLIIPGLTDVEMGHDDGHDHDP